MHCSFVVYTTSHDESPVDDHFLRIPEIKIIPGETVKETDFDIIDDPAAFTKLDVREIPLCVTLTKIGSWKLPLSLEPSPTLSSITLPHSAYK